MTKIYNIPQPYFLYLSSIGSVVDKMGKRTFLNVPTLPVTVARNKTGYHSVAVDEHTHSLYEEVPSLGIAGDVLMAIASAADNPRPEFGVTFPPRAGASANMLGTSRVIVKCRLEITQKLTSYGITGTQFEEYCQNTRFNRQYFRSLSDMIASWTTFRLEKVNFALMTSDGSTVQIIKSEPQDDRCHGGWLRRDVQNTSPEEETTAVMGAAFAFRFQLRKEAENVQGTVLERNANWCCVTSANPIVPFALPEAWVVNRNARAALPVVLGEARFRAITMNQGTVTEDVVRRMVKSQR